MRNAVWAIVSFTLLVVIVAVLLLIFDVMVRGLG
jgi:hypothetical protein